jgi:DNA polymerase-3 subunit epsilon
VPKQAGRPEFYDFDLFNQPGQNAVLDQRLLAQLSYTVFDTETTGLAPANGDEIISIGAVRIVNGRLLQHENFDQLVQPGMRLSAASIAIHGITDAMLTGQPAIAQVLPRFHRYAEETVLVAHNAAFDMRFLQLKEERTGIRFSQPVLDTLLLSQVIHPHQQGHSLEAIAARLGVTVIGRHTALGDAMLTGEVFLKMLPLLAEKGILTLKEARDAEQQTAYASIRY